MSRFAWQPGARADLRRIGQDQALSILHALDRYGRTGVGDIRKLTDDKQERYRLRVGDWRIFLKAEAKGVYRVYGFENRKDAHRD